MGRSIPVDYAILGAHHPHPSQLDRCDACDLALRYRDGSVAVVGLRTRGYLEARDGPEDWDGYIPLQSRDHAQPDDNGVHWLGPDDHPCVVYVTAEAFDLTRGALHSLLTVGKGNLLPKLPTLEQVGLERPSDQAWRPLTPSSVTGPTA